MISIIVMVAALLSGCSQFPFDDFFNRQAPSVGGGITIETVEFERFVASWPAADDVGTSSRELEYAVALSIAEEIDTYELAQINALYLSDWENGMLTFDSLGAVSVLDGARYRINVFARNRDGYIRSYGTLVFELPARSDLLLAIQLDQQILVNTSPFGGPISFDTGAVIAPSAFTNDMIGVLVADISFDGYLDVIMGRSIDPIVTYINIWPENPVDPFFEFQTLSTQYIDHDILATADVNSDGLSDLLAGQSFSASPISVVPSLSEYFAGSEISQIDPDWSNYTSDPVVILPADVNLDGYPDLVIARGNGVAEKNAVFLNDGTGVFSSGTLSAADAVLLDNRESTDIAVAPLTVGDDAPDIVSSHAGGVDLWVGDGDGSFLQHTNGSLLVGSSVATIALGDLDGDGDHDLVAGPTVGNMAIYLNVGLAADGVSGNWSGPYAPNPVFSNVIDVELSDLDGDGDMDLVATSTANQVQVWSNDAAVPDTDITFNQVAGFPQAIPADKIIVAPLSP